MTERIRHRKGDTPGLGCVAYTDVALANPRDLTNATVTASMDREFDDPISFTVEITDAANGEFVLRATAAQTAEWAEGVWNAFISYTEAGVVGSTEIFQIEVAQNFNPA